MVDLGSVYKKSIKDWELRLMQNKIVKQFVIIIMAKAGTIYSSISPSSDSDSNSEYDFPSS